MTEESQERAGAREWEAASQRASAPFACFASENTLWYVSNSNSMTSFHPSRLAHRTGGWANLNNPATKQPLLQPAVAGYEADCFWSFCCLVEDRLADYYTPGLPGVVRDARAVMSLLPSRLPGLSASMENCPGAVRLGPQCFHELVVLCGVVRCCAVLCGVVRCCAVSSLTDTSGGCSWLNSG